MEHLERGARFEHGGHTAFCIWTGEVAAIAMAPQTGLGLRDPEHTARVLNQRVARGERPVRR